MRDFKISAKGIQRVERFKRMKLDFFKEAMELMDDSRERSIFHTQLESACMFGVKAIIASEGNNNGETDMFKMHEEK